jgi:hypothetical protein
VVGTTPTVKEKRGGVVGRLYATGPKDNFQRSKNLEKILYSKIVSQGINLVIKTSSDLK